MASEKREPSMPTLVVENVPAEVYEYLEKRAAAQQRTLPEELLHLLQQALLWADGYPPPRLPELVPSEEVPAPFDLPPSSQPVPIAAYSGQPRLPDALPVGSLP